MKRIEVIKNRIEYYKTSKKMAELILRNFRDLDGIVGDSDYANSIALHSSRMVSKSLVKDVVGKESIYTKDECRLRLGNIFAFDKDWVIIQESYDKSERTEEVADLLHSWGGRIIGVCSLDASIVDIPSSMTYPSSHEILQASQAVEGDLPTFSVSGIPLKTLVK